MNTKLTDAEDRIRSLHRHYLQVLENAGFANLTTENPYISISHIVKRIKPARLDIRMKDIFKWP